MPSSMEGSRIKSINRQGNHEIELKFSIFSRSPEGVLYIMKYTAPTAWRAVGASEKKGNHAIEQMF